ncbi:efflux RND transporter periplasmic adaptor subunit [Flavobacterium sp. MAH-1]|uniref:Efflux RND transporter periplasmic adaptor subunit n=1 Tax=Flavobacterium agri TaxID=2743471 RepID=A0A7Y8Y0J4_9FLAO|nr:efflux RND transporter periplasmic adaptor subunit [Flavobacterium agri]NUY80273.1 efflux RND transporter periplasmic adaptor subunit [Flavobacterium agri]NYA70298.1 efflux RND transporter periplasmic adaptor subunit [Flavobacterium agri]
MKKIVMLAGFAAFLSLASCSSKTEAKEEAGKFTVTNPVVIDTAFTKEYVSQIRSVRNIEIRSQEKGFLEKIFVDEGQFVQAGQVLFRIMPKMYQAEFSKAEAEARAAEVELQNTKVLADKNVISRNEQKVAQAKLDQARAEMALAKLHLGFTEIRAPFSGTIDRIPKKLGSLIDEGELLTSLSDNTEMFAYFNVSEPEYIDYMTKIKDRGDSKVTLMLANGEPLKYKGSVEVIEGEFDNETGNIAFRAKFPNPDKLLRNGETGKIQMTFPVKDALIIPSKATYEIQDKKYVFVVGSDNKILSREVEVKGDLADLYVVTKGIKATDKILLDGVQKARDDQKIAYDFKDPKDVIAHLKLYAE